MHWLIHRAIGWKYIFKQSDSHKVFQLDLSCWIEKWNQAFILFEQTDQQQYKELTLSQDLMQSVCQPQSSRER
jgi:hypothetical protein